MEKSERVFTIMADYEWSNVGNWVSVREMEERNTIQDGEEYAFGMMNVCFAHEECNVCCGLAI